MVLPANVNYTTQTYSDIFSDLLMQAYIMGWISTEQDVSDYISNSKNIENTVILDISIMAYAISLEYESLDEIYTALDMANAVGTDLDILGEPFLTRLPEDYAVTTIAVTCEDPAINNVIIPAGTTLTAETDNRAIFSTIADATLLIGQTEVDIPVICLTPGPIGNVSANSLISFDQSIDGIDGVTNPLDASGGSDAESDADYRQRLQFWAYTLEKGTLAAILNAIRLVTAVTSYYIEPYFDGYGSTRIIIEPGTDATIQAVQQAVDNVKAVDEYFLVMGVTNVTVNVSLTVNIGLDQTLPPTQDVKDTVEIKASQYLSQFIQDLGIGADFVPYQAGAYLSTYVPEIASGNVTFADETPVTVGPEEKAVVGTIDITMV